MDELENRYQKTHVHSTRIYQRRQRGKQIPLSSDAKTAPPRRNDTSRQYAQPCGGGLIADFFSGSGTTAVACHNLRLDFIAVEKDPEYYEKSVQRLQDAQAQMRLF